MEPWADLRGKVVMVTGASSGLGREFCIDLSHSGCQIVAAARRVDRLKSLCDEINSSPAFSGSAIQPRAVSVELDVTADEPTIQRSVQKAWDAFGRIDALINDAGIRGDVNSALDLTADEWDRTFHTNVSGSWLVSKYVCTLMRTSEGGSVINISSIAGLNRGQLPGCIAYASSKAALNTMTTVMALELGKHNIRVNSISPGIFKSEITEILLRKQWLHNVVAKIAPMRTYGTSNPALTSIIRYLIHDSSQYVTGNSFVVDAGATLPGVPIFSSL